MKKISERAMILLRIVDENTDCDWTTGELKRFFVPKASMYFVDGIQTYISGAGDARSFKALERAGLIRRPKTTLPQDYVYAITEDGRLAIENAMVAS